MALSFKWSHLFRHVGISESWEHAVHVKERQTDNRYNGLGTGSCVSVASSNQLEEVMGPLSPMVNSPLQIVPNKSTPNKNVIKIASGSPSDITPSRDLR